MDYQLFPVIAVAFSVPVFGVILFLQKHARQPGARSLNYLLISILGWLVLNTLELVSPTQGATLLWGKLTYIFIGSTPVLWLYFVFDYFGYKKWMELPETLCYWLIPLISLVLVLTNEWHHLIWKEIFFVPVGNYLALQVTHGPFYYLTWGYSLILILIGCVLIWQGNFGRSRLYRWQAGWLTAGVITVMAFSVIYVSHVIPGFRKDYTSVAMAFGALCFAIAISRYKMIIISPIDIGTLFEELDDGILVVDGNSIIVNINSAARRLLSAKENDLVGKSLCETFCSFPGLAKILNVEAQTRFDFCFCEAPPRYLNLKVSAIQNSYGQLRGHLILISDVTREKIAQAAEHEARVFAEALSEISTAMNSTRNLDELLDLIIANVIRLISCDSANIMMIDQDYAYPVRSLEPLENSVRLSIERTGTLHWMWKNRRPMVIPDVNDNSEWVTTPETAWINSYVGAPIVAIGDVIGFINLDSAMPGFYRQETGERLQAFANQASIAIQNARIYEQLEEMATIDSLTNLFSRRYFFDLATKEYERACRYHHPLSAIMVDLDFFKEVNDTYGHLAGDQMLRRVAAECMKELRSTDFIGRYGGEEFAILLPETDLEMAKKVADRLCDRIARIELRTAMSILRITASMGVATMSSSCERLEDLLAQSDQALYLAKESGRNRVEVFLPTSDEQTNFT